MKLGSGQPVLVVDNNDDALAVLGKELKELGHEPVTTWSGVEALRLLKSRRFGALLVDSYLPDMYIGDFLQRVSGLPTIPKIWVMHARPAQDVCAYGSLSFPVIGKNQVARTLKQLATGIDGEPSTQSPED